MNLSQKQIEFVIFQKNLCKLVEIVLNSQTFIPNAIKKLKILKESCYKTLGFLQNKTGNNLKNSVDIISYFYKNYLDFNSSIQSDTKNVNNVNIVLDNQYELSEYSKEVRDFLNELEKVIKNKISPFIIGIFIHGSIATNDYTGFSDADAGIIIKDEVMLNPKFLKELKKNIKGVLKIMLKFDNLQHHGFFIIPEGFLDNYPEDYLPIDVFKSAKTVSSPFDLKIRAYRNSGYAKEKFLKTAKIFLQEKTDKPKSLYELKSLLSAFMLLPTLYLQAKGNYIYKKFSFDIVKKEFLDDWWVMDEVSQIRQDWVRPKSGLFNTLVDTLPNPWMASLIYRKLDWKISYWLTKRLNKELYGGIMRLAEKMVQKIRRSTQIGTQIDTDEAGQEIFI